MDWPSSSPLDVSLHCAHCLRHSGTARARAIFRFGTAGVIQLVECQLPKLDVAGSSPVARSLQDNDLRDLRERRVVSG